ncbi:MAG: ParB/RepB/Spo0J family partition protein [Deltaproteobacteria bacterium]|jgi:ParB family chromosome partitioning protein|nr:ParB/RepB/Spo0J family partition protein [Deltaproteobacteria bacterium]
MTISLACKKIPLPFIDFGDTSYAIAPDADPGFDENLALSIARFGILHPPLVKEPSSGSYRIVAGRKRLLAARSLQEESSCSCLVVPLHTSEIETFSLLLEETGVRRPLTLTEKANFLQKTVARSDEEFMVKEFLPRLGLAPRRFTLQQTLRLCSLEPEILLALHEGVLSEKSGWEFLQLPAGDRLALFAIVNGLRLGGSYQKKLLDITKDLAGRSGKSIAGLLACEAVAAILHHSEANPPQKTKMLMHWLHRQHMARYSRASEEFNRFAGAMQLPENVSLTPAPAFEDESLTLSITFPNRKSLQHAWKQVRKSFEADSD